MKERDWKIRSFLLCFVCNGILMAVFLALRNGRGPGAAVLMLALGTILTFGLWFLLSFTDGGLNPQADSKQTPPPAPIAHSSVSEGQSSPEAAIQLLATLQRGGRLIDFFQEDLSTYEDGQIGAAVRGIHAGCRETLKEYVELKPVFQEKEGAMVTIPSGFDATAIRLTGKVTGNPPFRGILRHRGWQVERIQLPQPTGKKKDWILASAEVEIE